MIQTGGTLGSASQTEQASAAEPQGTAGCPKDLVEIWTKVSDHLRANPDKGVLETLKSLGIPTHKYYQAKRRMESNEKPPSGRNWGQIRADDPIVRNTKQAAEAEEDEDELRRRRVAAMESASSRRVAENDDGGVPRPTAVPPAGSTGIDPATECLKTLKKIQELPVVPAESEDQKEDEAEEPPLPETVLVEVMAWLRQLPAHQRHRVIDAARVIVSIDQERGPAGAVGFPQAHEGR